MQIVFECVSSLHALCGVCSASRVKAWLGIFLLTIQQSDLLPANSSSTFCHFSNTAVSEGKAFSLLFHGDLEPLKQCYLGCVGRLRSCSLEEPSRAQVWAWCWWRQEDCVCLIQCGRHCYRLRDRIRPKIL